MYLYTIVDYCLQGHSWTGRKVNHVSTGNTRISFFLLQDQTISLRCVNPSRRLGVNVTALVTSDVHTRNKVPFLYVFCPLHTLTGYFPFQGIVRTKVLLG